MAGNDWAATQTWSALGDLERRLQSWHSSVSHCVDAWGRQVTQECDFYKDRVQRVRDALNASGGIAYQMTARKLHSGVRCSQSSSLERISRQRWNLELRPSHG